MHSDLCSYKGWVDSGPNKISMAPMKPSKLTTSWRLPQGSLCGCFDRPLSSQFRCLLKTVLRALFIERNCSRHMSRIVLGKTKWEMPPEIRIKLFVTVHVPEFPYLSFLIFCIFVFAFLFLSLHKTSKSLTFCYLVSVRCFFNHYIYDYCFMKFQNRL